MAAEPVPTWSPRAHGEGIVTLLTRLARDRERPELPALRELIGEPSSLPVRVGAEGSGLKYDAYMSCAPGTERWGVTLNDRFERDAFTARVQRFVDACDAPYAMRAVEALRAVVDPEATVTFSVGFDERAAPPRLKFYFQEDRWGRGVADAATLEALARQLDANLAWPGWLAPDARIGVASIELLPGGATGLKLYVGAQRASAAARGAPRKVRLLAQIMEQACPLAATYYYLTIRLRGGVVRHAINKIYNTAQLLDPAHPASPQAAWRDVAGLFAVAGQGPAFAALRRLVAERDDLTVLPTASALEGKADTADVYFSAWAPVR